MSSTDCDPQRYFQMLERKLDIYFQTVLQSEPSEQLNAELKGFLEAGMVLNIATKDVLDAKIKSRCDTLEAAFKPAVGAEGDA